MEASVPFGPWLKQLRTSRDLTQEELATQVGCAVETIRKLEAGVRRPSKEIAHRLAEVLFADQNKRQRFVERARGLNQDVSSSSVSSQRHNLPAQLTSFIGREREVAEVRELLSASRLVTLTGVGGTGKTRLALEVTATLCDAYTGGVWLLELAPLVDAALVPQTVAAVLGLREEPGRPLLATLTAALREAPTLLIFDNCEHLIAASAHTTDTLLRACPQLRILATSREALCIAGETTYVVSSLPTPVRGIHNG
jgi:predicted ATPase